MIYLEIYFYLFTAHLLSGVIYIRLSDKSADDKEDAYIGWFIFSLFWWLVWALFIYNLLTARRD